MIISSPSFKKINSIGGSDTNHLSLGYVGSRLGKVADMAGLNPILIDSPDIYRNKLTSKFLGSKNCDGVKFHLSVASWDEMRLSAIAKYNYCHLSWEQTEIGNNESLPQFGSCMLTTLKHFDRVACCADFLKDTMLRYGIKNSYYLPTPITNPTNKKNTEFKIDILVEKYIRSIFSPFLYKGPGCGLVEAVENLNDESGANLLEWLKRKANGEEVNVFITQGNIGDVRKNLITLMLGFGLFSEKNNNSILIIKTAQKSKKAILEEIGGNLQSYIRWGWFGSKKIFIMPATVSDDEQYCLYGNSDFYISTSIAEGQNIPLQEAIQCGCYPISVYHTAMKEYLEIGTFEEIVSNERILNSIDYCNVGEIEYKGYLCDPMDIANACENAVAMSKKSKIRSIKTLQNEYLKKYTYEDSVQRFIDFVM